MFKFSCRRVEALVRILTSSFLDTFDDERENVEAKNIYFTLTTLEKKDELSYDYNTRNS